MHHLCHCHIVDAPFVRCPIRSAQGLVFCPLIYIRYMRRMAIHISGGAIVLLSSSHPTVYRSIDAPKRCIAMYSLQAHEVLIFRPMTGILQPQSLVHRLQYSVGFILIGFRILTDDFSYAGRQAVAAIVVGGRMGHGTTVVLQGIARPDAAIGIVKSIVIGVPSLLLPCQMALDYRPHLAHIRGIGIKLEVPQQFVYIHQIHVVMMKLVVLLRISAYIARAVHRRSPLVGTTRQVIFLIHQMRFCNGHIGYLTLGVCIKVGALSVWHSKKIAHVGSSPSRQRHAPSHGSMLPHLTIPGTIGSHHQSSTDRIDIGIGGMETD